MVKIMKEVNKYFIGYNETENKIDYIKYGILNEFGYNVDSSLNEIYNEEKIIKKS